MEREHTTNDASPVSTLPASSVQVPAGLEDSNARPLAGASAGLVAGAALGAFAGPVGAIAGGIVGVVVGGAAGAALDTEAQVEAAAEAELDQEIGVIDGPLGAASPNAPPARRGAFSAASSGIGGTAGDESTPDEGPIPKSD